MQARMCEKLRRCSCFTWECAFQRSANHESRPRTRSSILLLFSRSYLFAIMADNNGKRKLKAWVYFKEAKVPRTTAWRSKKGTSSSASVSKITTSHVEEVLQSSCSIDIATSNDFESSHVPSEPSSPATNSDHIIEPCDDQSINMDSEDEFLSINTDTDSVTSDEESENGVERADSSTDSEFNNEDNDEISDGMEGFEMDKEEINDDNVPLYEGANVSRLGALVIVMLFSLRHQLSGQALIDLVKVLRALLPDGHRFVPSAYLLKKYFSDLFGEPAPKKHSYCGNCLRRIRKGQAQCLKEKCQRAKKKIEYLLGARFTNAALSAV